METFHTIRKALQHLTINYRIFFLQLGQSLHLFVYTESYFLLLQQFTQCLPFTGREKTTQPQRAINLNMHLVRWWILNTDLKNALKRFLLVTCSVCKGCLSASFKIIFFLFEMEMWSMCVCWCHSFRTTAPDNVFCMLVTVYWLHHATARIDWKSCRSCIRAHSFLQVDPRFSSSECLWLKGILTQLHWCPYGNL